MNFIATSNIHIYKRGSLAFALRPSEARLTLINYMVDNISKYVYPTVIIYTTRKSQNLMRNDDVITE